MKIKSYYNIKYTDPEDNTVYITNKYLNLIKDYLKSDKVDGMIKEKSLIIEDYDKLEKIIDNKENKIHIADSNIVGKIKKIIEIDEYQCIIDVDIYDSNYLKDLERYGLEFSYLKFNDDKTKIKSLHIVVG